MEHNGLCEAVIRDDFRLSLLEWMWRCIAHGSLLKFLPNVEWWHRRGKLQIQPLARSPVATHGLCAPSMGALQMG
jgi:hypothetical protein